MRKLLAVMLLAGAALASYGADVQEQRRQRTAARQLQQMGITSDPAKLAESEGYVVYGAAAGGFVVLNKYGDGTQVLGYSPSAYVPDKMPCGLQWWLRHVDQALQHGAAARRARKYSQVDNFLKTRWDQGTPYNDRCPIIDKSHAPAGCIATALAQVLRYYEWPAQGQGMGGYTVNDNYVEEAVNGVYNWTNMPYVTYGAATKQAIKTAVATLVYDCGKASRMSYTAEGSGAFTNDQALALARNFQYDSLALQYCERVFYSSEQWMSMIDAELQARRPILYAATDAEGQGAHAFVLSGIDKSGMVYVNWGWGGAGDGFYEVDLLDVPGYKFSQGQEMNIGIQPMPESGPTGTYHSRWSVYYFAKPAVSSRQRKLTIPYYFVYNAHFLPFTGQVGLFVESTDGKGYAQLKLLEQMSPGAIEYGKGYTNLHADEQDNYDYDPIEVDFDELPAGAYKLTWVSKDHRESAPQSMLCEDTDWLKQSTFYLSKANNGTLTVSNEEIASGLRLPSVSESLPLQYYRLDGTAAAAPRRGITIVRQGSSVRKVIR